MLAFVSKIANLSNDSRVSKRDVKSFSSQYILDGGMYLMYHYLKKRQIEDISRFGNLFYHECFLQYFEGCTRVLSFHLNNLDNEVMNSSLDVILTATNWIKRILKIVPKLVLTEVIKVQP